MQKQPTETVPISLKERKGQHQTQPFVPLTGNPENGDYLDYYRALHPEARVLILPSSSRKES